MDLKHKTKKPRPSSNAQAQPQPPLAEIRSGAENDQNQQQSFEMELAWCIEQLEMGLTSAKKPSQKQAQDAIKVIKILKNPTAPLVKKRQAMRNTFGDYRTKMKEDEKRYLSSAQKISLKTGSDENKKKYTFLKKSSCQSEENPNQPALQFSENSSSFAFNFQEDSTDVEINKESVKDPTTEEKMNSLSLHSESMNVTSSVSKSESMPGESIFKMTSTDNTFRFDFDVTESEKS